MFADEPEIGNSATSANKLVLSEQDNLASLGLPEEALMLLMNIKEKEDKKTVVLSGNEANLEHLSMLGMPEEAMKLLQDMKNPQTPPKKEVKQTPAQQEEDLLAPKLSFNPDSGFTMSADMLAKLNLFTPPAASAPEVQKAGSNESLVENYNNQKFNMPVDFGPSIDISVTNNYTPQEATSLVRSFNINEEGLFLGIILGSTTKAHALEILSKHSKFKFDENTPELIVAYDDLSVTLYFDDENIVEQFEFGRDFRGQTSKGLKIGDTMESAIEYYGPPKMKSPRGAVWEKIKVFCADGFITSIKIQK